MLLGALPMYDWPEQHEANNQLWELLSAEFRASGVNVSTSLHRQGECSDLWLSPKMLVSQTCGLPLVTSLLDQVKSFAAPVFEVEGAGSGTYSSAIIVRKTDPAQSIEETANYRIGYNGVDSQSGYACLRHFAYAKGLEQRHFKSGIRTGSHRQSVRKIAEGQIDLAAIDCLSWDLAQEHDPEFAAQLRVIDWTVKTPAMPYIVNQHSPINREEMLEIFTHVIAEQASFNTLQQLRLKAVIPCNNAFFQPIVDQVEASKHFELTK